jgi:hypothetical protein
MSELVKSALERVINTYGISLCSEPARLKGLLYDLCPTHRKEIDAVLLVVQEGLLFELKRGGTDKLRLKSLAARLYNTRGIDKTLALWALRVWTEALGLAPSPKRKRDVSRSGKTSTRKTAADKLGTHSAPPIHLLGKARSVVSASQVASVGHTPPPSPIQTIPSPVKLASKPYISGTRLKVGLAGAAILFVVGILMLVLKTIEPPTTEVSDSKICTFSTETTNGPSWYTIYTVGYGEAARLRIDIDIFDARGVAYVGDTVGATEHFIIKSLTTYTWKNGEKKGYKFSIKPLQFIEHFEFQKTNLACRRWALDDSVFDVPKEINFLTVMNPWKAFA